MPRSSWSRIGRIVVTTGIAARLLSTVAYAQQTAPTPDRLSAVQTRPAAEPQPDAATREPIQLEPVRTDLQPEAPRAFAARVPPRRPRSLVPLYITFGTLQALDAHSTLRGISSGQREANPVVNGLAGRPGAVVAIKAATAATTILVTEQIWKRNRLAAVATMVAVNSAYAVIAAHNYRMASR
jgi:hypothetical protein